ncbi:SPOR domain-containing protein [Paraburkholderia bonniea]|uniref:SPOR domain-containing protein n=1 Tax=Paraburkholderia bonniea TaxID=2152891 RepID=UPI0025739BA7|nr:SPOR domain-containing protein [Paraburkholderia bonniea]WJF91726.1 SPOR domain-containing protein [Paraburkholderia bonniea]WJF95046.1 SPOR domain-containing protein [Paraburkholderia bonniea]
MGLFSSSKKDGESVRRGNRTGGGSDARSERVERRTRRTDAASEADAMLLDPTLPEKQRARRRLVGAIALVVAAVVILPMVLDSHPKPVTADIAIDIPSRPATKAVAAEEAQAASDDSAADTEPGTGPQALDEAASSSATPGSSRTSSPHTSPAVVSPDANAHPANASSAAPAKSATKATPQTDPGTPVSPPGSRFAVQLGSFPDEASARDWATRLKAAGVPAYIERRKQADGSTRTLLRAGPFADRAAASAVIAKVRAAGLTLGGNNEAAR